jgi:DNA-binding NtrC family response regulator
MSIFHIGRVNRQPFVNSLFALASAGAAQRFSDAEYDQRLRVMRRSVFYFDDEPVLLEIFQEMFGDEYDVRTTTKLAEARRMLRECRAEIIITDENMPEINGSAFLREVVATCPHSFRIMLTGTVFVGDMFAEVAAGLIDIFIPKPWQEEQMRHILERASAVLESRRDPTSDNS